LTYLDVSVRLAYTQLHTCNYPAWSPNHAGYGEL
jgi:hypothetical protein